MAEETAIAIREEQVPSLLTGSPSDRVKQATEVANALAPVITDKKLFATINNRRHVLFEGWTTLGALMGVFPVTVSVETMDGGQSYEAHVEARTLAGAVVGSAIALCSRDEKSWTNRDAFALMSMAQTRAGSKALRMPLGFIMQLAGYEATPAEEMGAIDGTYREVEPKNTSQPDHSPDAPATNEFGYPPRSGKMTAAQKGYLFGGGKTPLDQALTVRYMAKMGGGKGIGEALEANTVPSPVAMVLKYQKDGKLSWAGGMTEQEATDLISCLKEELGIGEPGEATSRSAFWAHAKELGVDKAAAHAFFRVGPEDGALTAYVAAKAKALKFSKADAWKMMRSQVERAVELDALLEGVQP